MTELGRSARDRVEDLQCGNQLAGSVDSDLDAPTAEFRQIAREGVGARPKPWEVRWPGRDHLPGEALLAARRDGIVLILRRAGGNSRTAAHSGDEITSSHRGELPSVGGPILIPDWFAEA